jgi:hypothetical protein
MAPNERLRDAVMRSGHTPQTIAQHLNVDPKTVERWMTQDRVPYPRHRHDIAARVGESETWLWPNAYSRQRVDQAARSELVEFFPRRSLITGDRWQQLLSSPAAFLDVLVYAGLFLPEQTPGLTDLLKERAAAGVRVRLLLGDPASTAVATRGAEEGIGEAVATKIRNALHLYRPLSKKPGISVRLHAATLYTSIYRADDEMIANQHVLGLPAAQSPAMHLRKLAAGDLFDTYTAMFDRVWESAAPAW